MAMPKNPQFRQTACPKDCPRRKVGCHNVNTCPEWAEHVRRQQERQRAKAQMYDSYLIDRDFRRTL